MAHMERGQPQQRDLAFMHRDFSSYSDTERIALATAVREKKEGDLTDEERRYKIWREALGDDDNPYKER